MVCSLLQATFVGGGYGEKKSFWKNNERNPIKMPMEANNWYEVGPGRYYSLRHRMAFNSRIECSKRVG